MPFAWVAAVMAMATMAGRAEAQGLPIRVSIGARATVLPLPSPQTVTVDTALVTASVMATVQPADTTSVRVRRQRLVVVSYPGT